MKNLCFFLTLLPFSSQSQADDIVFCTDMGMVDSQCIIDSKILSGRPFYEGKTYEAEFEVEYSFPCRGSKPLGVGVANGDSWQVFEMGAMNRTLTGVLGSGELKIFDPDPQQTAQAFVNKDCFLEIHRVGVFPSFNTLNLWQAEMDMQAKIIELATNAWEATLTLEYLVDWDDQQLNILFKAIEDRIGLYSSRCEDDIQGACMTLAHFKVMKGSLSAWQYGHLEVSSIGATELNVSIHELFKREALREAEIGREMLTRTKYFSINFDSHLADMVDSYNRLAKQGAL